MPSFPVFQACRPVRREEVLLRHWRVQYKFCKPVFAEMRQCEPDERAVTINTEVKTWKPYIDQARCRCPHSTGTSTLYQLSGWKREGAQWKYHYNCHKVECKYYPLGTELNKRGSECAKVYIDQYKTSDKVQEVIFLCACPEGQMCPARLRKDNKDEVDLKEDDHGIFVMKYCESNHQTENNK
ncbi:hypothetical protein C0Q70_07911 [Pomacea canaliculata]|uniref:Uncharacterized protein n=1 Tax=Pomacea canaliculata TaxID=400727 RepID=A0A2T7PGC1_POMCA|nr:hypothetical protein C0Q70_07911 [Pomacea canaliculata]